MRDAGTERRLDDEEVRVLHEVVRGVGVGRERGIDERAVEARRAARGGLPASGRRAGESDGEEGERGGHRVGRARRVEADLDDRHRAARAAHDEALLAVLRRLRRLGRIDVRLGVERHEGLRRAVDELIRRRIADDDDVRVVRRVVAAVVRVQAVAGHELDLVLAPDDALAVGMAVERDRLQLLAEEERGIVLETLALAHDDRALGLGLLARDERVAHAVGLELERDTVALTRHRLEIAGDVLAREGVPEGAVPGEELVEIALGMERRALEQHVLEEVRHARRPGHLVAPANVVPDPEGHDRRMPRLEAVERQPVLETARNTGVGRRGDGERIAS